MEALLEKIIKEIETIQGNEVLRTIYDRRSIRKYKDKAVERNLIDQIVDAGRMAPSAMNKQPWKFYVLTDKEQIKAFSNEITKAAASVFYKKGIKSFIKSASSSFQLTNGVKFLKEDDRIFHGAPVVIFICSPEGNEWAPIDIGMCSQNIMLAAKSLGLDTCPVGLGKYVEETKLYSTLNIPKSEKVTLSIVLGYGNETPDVHERIKNNVVYL